MKNAVLSIALSTALMIQTEAVAFATDKAKADSSNPMVVQTMHGYVSTSTEMDAISSAIDEVMTKAIEKSVAAQKSKDDVVHFSTRAARVFKSTKDIVNFMLCDRGFMPSVEGGNLMLEEGAKAHSKPSAEYVHQHWIDATNDKVVEDVVELATAIGMPEGARRSELVKGAMDSLSEAAGPETAKHVYDRLAVWSQKLSASATFDKPAWSIKEREKKIDAVVSTCLKEDPVAIEIRNRVHKWSKRSKLAIKSSQVIETSLNAASLTPTFIGPGAQAALLVFFMATGGTEEDKLLSEMYLGKRLDSRKCSLRNQAAIAIDGYQLGVLTHNNALTECSQSIIRRLGGSDLQAAVFSPESASDKPAAVATSSGATAASAAAGSIVAK